jgi:hypothetical protein
MSRRYPTGVRFSGFVGGAPQWEGLSSRRVARFAHESGRIVLVFVAAVATSVSGLIWSLIRGSWASLGIGTVGLVSSVFVYFILRSVWRATPPG